MIPGVEPEPYGLGEHLVSSSSKIMMIDKILADVLPKGEKALIFTVSPFLKFFYKISNI